MNEIEIRLSECFRRVFPALETEAIPTASQRNLSAWDSVAAISLVNVIEDEFNTTIEFEDMAELNSFGAIAGHLQRRMSDAS